MRFILITKTYLLEPNIVIFNFCTGGLRVGEKSIPKLKYSHIAHIM